MRRATLLIGTILWAGCDLATPTVARPTPVPSDRRVGQETEPAGGGQARSSLARACAFLYRQQAADGGWHSETYGLLNSGQALTPFILRALLDVPEEMAVRPDGAIQRALDFIRRHAGQRGIVGISDAEVLEYPNYSTAYALLCLLEAGSADDQPLIRQMTEYLIGEQFCEARGFDLSMPAYGGWGYGGTHPPGETGHMDLAHTRRVIQALRAAITAGPALENSDKTESDVAAQIHAALGRAELILKLLQKHPSDPRPQPMLEGPLAVAPDAYDGGFYFSPVVLAANKGRTDLSREPGPWRSYATATCDGLLALLAAGVPVEDERVQSARAWLARHPRVDLPAGVPRAPDEHPEPWAEAIRFYHFAVRAEASAALDWPHNWRIQLAQEIVTRQQDDGSFVNADSPLMKEDDPLLCTALAVTALARVQSGTASD